MRANVEDLGCKHQREDECASKNRRRLLEASTWRALISGT
jgi:hypothetical protein